MVNNWKLRQISGQKTQFRCIASFYILGSESFWFSWAGSFDLLYFVNASPTLQSADHLLGVAKVILDNGDALISITVEDNNEFAHTVACGRSGNDEVLKKMLNTGYGTRHWMAPSYIGNGSIVENVRRFNEKI